MGDAVATELRLLLEQQAGTQLADCERRSRHIGNLIAVEQVTAAGEQIRASESENPDLF